MQRIGTLGLLSIALWGALAARAGVPAVRGSAELVTHADVAAGARSASWANYVVPRLFLGVLVTAVLLGIHQARRGRVLPVRDLPALALFEDAIGRATELGRPVLFTVGGATDLRRVQLFGALPMLRETARISAQLENRLLVPVCYAETIPAITNSIREGYQDAGATIALRPDDIRFFPGGQFFFALGAMGWMLEERPAACFYFGYWEADALLFAETGHLIDAIQIAGTDQLPQVPFFVAACDATLFGEEFWAASARLSGDAALAGSLGAQDLCKLAILFIIILGCLASTFPAAARALRAVQLWMQ